MEDHTIDDLEAVLMRPMSYSIEDHCVFFNKWRMQKTPHLDARMGRTKVSFHALLQKEKTWLFKSPYI